MSTRGRVAKTVSVNVLHQKMRMMKTTVTLAWLIGTTAVALGEIVHVGLPSWTVERKHAISNIQVRRESLGTVTIPSCVRNVGNAQEISRLAELFSSFTGADELMNAKVLTEPLFTLVITHSAGTNELTVTVERGMLSQQGMGKPTPCASVCLWEMTPEGGFREWGHHTYSPVKTSEAPEPIAVLAALFQDRKTMKNGEQQGGGCSPSHPPVAPASATSVVTEGKWITAIGDTKLGAKHLSPPNADDKAFAQQLPRDIVQKCVSYLGEGGSIKPTPDAARRINSYILVDLTYKGGPSASDRFLVYSSEDNRVIGEFVWYMQR